MLVKVDFSLPVFRMLYNDLYNRVLSRAIQDGDNENSIISRFAALMLGDERVQLLVNVENNTLVGHCLLAYSPPIVFIEQINVDSKNDEQFVRDCTQYVESLTNVEIIKMFTTENKYRAFRKKYEFEVERIVMSRIVKRD